MILVVEDNDQKAESIQHVLRDAGIPDHQVHIAVDLKTARELLSSKAFHGLIIDLNIPTVFGRVPSPDVGVKLLDEVTALEGTRAVEYILGLTARPELLGDYRQRFETAIQGLQLYAEGSGWQGAVRRLAASVSRRSTNKPVRADVLIHTALTDPEMSAVVRVFKLKSGHEWSAGGRPVFRGSISIPGAQLSIAAVCSYQMGMPAAAVTLADALHRFRPKVVVHTGICGGVRGHVKLGDVLIADPCFDYGSGKWVANPSEGKTRQFRPDPRQERLTEESSMVAGALEADQTWLLEALRDWPGAKPDSSIALRRGPFASGAAVVANGRVLEEVGVQSQRKLLGIDMEAYAVMSAALRSSHRPKYAAAIKSVCDFADETKDDAVQHVAAHLAACAAKQFVVASQAMERMTISLE